MLINNCPYFDRVSKRKKQNQSIENANINKRRVKKKKTKKILKSLISQIADDTCLPLLFSSVGSDLSLSCAFLLQSTFLSALPLFFFFFQIVQVIIISHLTSPRFLVLVFDFPNFRFLSGVLFRL